MMQIIKKLTILFIGFSKNQEDINLINDKYIPEINSNNSSFALNQREKLDEDPIKTQDNMISRLKNNHKKMIQKKL